MPLSNVNYYFEGDFDFIIKAVEMFKEFDNFREDSFHFTNEFLKFFIDNS